MQTGTVRISSVSSAGGSVTLYCRYWYCTYIERIEGVAEEAAATMAPDMSEHNHMAMDFPNKMPALSNKRGICVASHVDPVPQRSHLTSDVRETIL